MASSSTTTMTVSQQQSDGDVLYDADADELSRIQRVRAPSTRFYNWARTFTCLPSTTFYPSNEQEVRTLVRAAKKQGRCLRAVGVGHSPSDLVCVGTDDWLVSLKHFEDYDDVQLIDRDRGIVTASGGITLKELHVILKERYGLAISSLGSISDQTLAGAISTATHGSSHLFGNLSSFVTQLNVVTASDDDGDCPIITCSRDDENEKVRELFEASRCGLGLTGIITRVGMQCEPAFNLEEEEFSMTTDDFIEAIRDGGERSIATSSQHIQGWWHTQSGEIHISRMNRTKKSAAQFLTPFASHWPRFASITRWIRDRLLGYHWHQVGLLIGRVFPNFLTWHARFMYHSTLKNGCTFDADKPFTVRTPAEAAGTELKPDDPAFPRCSPTTYRIGNSVQIFNYDCLFPQYTYEGVVPVDRAQACLRELQTWLEGECRTRNGMRHHFPIEIRFTGKDDVWLSPTNGMVGCYIGIVQYKPYGLPVTYRALFREFERIIFAHGGKPHWAKSYTADRQTLERMFPRLNDFMRVREQWDPRRVFVNPYARRHFFDEKSEATDSARFKTTTQSLEDKIKLQ